MHTPTIHHNNRWLLAGGPVDALWERDPQELVRQLEACIKVCAQYIYIHVSVYTSTAADRAANTSQHQHPANHTALPGVPGAVPRGAGQAAADAQGQAVRLPRAPHLRPLRGPYVCVYVCTLAAPCVLCVWTLPSSLIYTTPRHVTAVRGAGAEAHRALHDAGPVPCALAEQAGGHGGGHCAVPRHRQGRM